MTKSTLDLAKLQNLIATATNPRQKAMYEKLLEKAKKQLGESFDAVPKKDLQQVSELNSISSSTKKSAPVSSTVKTQLQASSKQKQNQQFQQKLEKGKEKLEKGKEKNSKVQSQSKSKGKTKNNKLSQSQTENKIEAEKKSSNKQNKIISVKKAEKSDDKEIKQKKNKSAKKAKNSEESKAANSKSESSKKSKPDKSKSDTPTEVVEKPKIIFFQAIGVIEGFVALEEEELWITLDKQKYHLGYVPHKKVFYDALVREIRDTGSKVKKVSVYPQLTHNQEKKEIKVKFALVSVSKSEKDKALFKKLIPGEFQVSGFWQYVPFCDSPCVSIKRNYTKNLAKMVEKMETVQARYFIRSNVIPLVWDEPTVESFKYNPELEKHKQMPRYFVQLKVFFTPTENKFTFVEQLEEPLLDAPKYLKAESAKQMSKKSS